MSLANVGGRQKGRLMDGCMGGTDLSSHLSESGSCCESHSVWPAASLFTEWEAAGHADTKLLHSWGATWLLNLILSFESEPLEESSYRDTRWSCLLDVS